MQFADLDIESLIGLLAKHTEEYIQMRSFTTCTVEEIAQRKQALWELQIAINLKRQQPGDTTDYIIPDLPDYNLPQQEQPQTIENRCRQATKKPVWKHRPFD